MHWELLDKIPLFAGLTGDEKWDLARRINIRDVPAGHPLFWINERGEEFFVIQSGHVAITVPDPDGKREVTLAVLGPGDFFGEVSLLDGGPRTATARTQTEASLLVVGRDQFGQFIRDFPSAAAHILETLGKRQRNSVEKIRGIRNLNEVMDQKLTAWQKIANAIAALAASKTFLLLHACGFAGWIVLNLLLRHRAPDPYPFSFLCLWSSTEAIFLSLFILISQNMQSQKDRLRTELEYQVALKAQFEIMQLHRKLDALPGTLREMMEEKEPVPDEQLEGQP
jgi:uncharacterized membrane protein